MWGIRLLEEILKDQTLTKAKKKQKVFELFNVSKKGEPAKCALLTLITGGTAAADCKNICISSSFDDNAPLDEAAFAERFEQCKTGCRKTYGADAAGIGLCKVGT